MSTRVRIYKFKLPSRSLKAFEARLNKQLAKRFPRVGHVDLMERDDGMLAFRLAVDMAPGQKALLDEVYNFVTTALGQRRGRKPGVKKVQVKLRIARDVRDKVKAAADKCHQSVSEVVELCLKERYG